MLNTEKMLKAIHNFGVVNYLSNVGIVDNQVTTHSAQLNRRHLKTHRLPLVQGTTIFCHFGTRVPFFFFFWYYGTRVRTNKTLSLVVRT
jgi:hypothetical protein